MWTVIVCTCSLKAGNVAKLPKNGYVAPVLDLNRDSFENALKRLSNSSQEAMRKLSGDSQENVRKLSGSSQEPLRNPKAQETCKKLSGIPQETRRRFSGDPLRQWPQCVKKHFISTGKSKNGWF